MIKLKSLLMLLCLTVAGSCFVSCGDDEQPPAEEPHFNATLDFLEIGNEWVYEYTYYDENENATSNVVNTSKLTDTGTYRGAKGYYFNDITAPPPQWLESDDALYFYSGSSWPDLYKECYKGQKWSNDNEETKEVVEINATVEVKGGIFTDCIKIRGTNSKQAEEIVYISNKYGYVLWEFEGYSATSNPSWSHWKRELTSKNF